MNTAEYQWDLVRRLSFTRPAGTPECEKAAQIIGDEVKSMGGTVFREDFTFRHFVIDKAFFKVTKPYEKEYGVTAVAYSGNLSGTFPFKYVERAVSFDMENTDGAIVMMNQLDENQYKPVAQSSAAGFITPSGKWFDSPETTDLAQSRLGGKLREMGVKPGMRIRCADALEMVRRGASEVQCEIEQHEQEFTTQNLYSVIEGTDKADEYITFSAHYDSVATGIGAFDNATGCAALLELYRYFTENKPRHTMVFLWCGAEELGLLGSQEFVKKHPEIMEKARMEVNFDLTGCLLGYDGVSIAAPQNVCDLMQQFADERRHAFEVRRQRASTDSNAFAEAGIPAFNFFRYGEAELHNCNDQLFPLSGESMAKTVGFTREFVQWCDSADEFPFAREIGEEMMKDIKAYFGR